MPVWIDFETRSEAELRKIGTYNYAAHRTTDAQCMAFMFEDRDEVFLWHHAFPVAGLPACEPPELDELFDRIAMGDEIHAHNAMFERCIWRFVMERRYGWLPVRETQWRCSAALSASYALPRKLDDVAHALRLPLQKDMTGNRLAIRMARPRKPRKAELRAARCTSDKEFYRRHGALWYESRQELEQLFAYCKQDVRVERAVDEQLRPLSPAELAVWQLDQKINLRGVYCDREMVDAALGHAGREEAISVARVRELSAGLVDSPTKRAEFLEWCRWRGFPLPDTQGSTIDAVLAAGHLVDAATGQTLAPPPDVREAMEIWRRANRTSTKKYRSMLDRMAESDDRIRDILRYHGASTGRWAGVGIQPQNFPRGDIKDIDSASAAIRGLDHAELVARYGDVMELLSGSLRGALCASLGKELVVADYSAIEARGTFWLADDRAALEVLRSGHCIYKDMAGAIYGVGDPQSIPKGDPRRQVGKAAVLGLGYQMGPAKFITTCATQGIQLEPTFAERVVETYRAQHRAVKQLWWDLEAAAIEAVVRGRKAAPVESHRTRWAVRGRFLHCRLPSGRLLSYCRPRIGRNERYGNPELQFWGVDSYTHKWMPQSTYGGKLTENVVQALSRDLIADAMQRVEDAGYAVVLSVHDEVVAEVDEGWGDLKQFEALMAQVPAWAEGLPVVAEGWRGRRYRK